jgi:hypothetical protein
MLYRGLLKLKEDIQSITNLEAAHWYLHSLKGTLTYALPTPWGTQMWVPNRKQWKSKESGHAPWLIALWKGRGACWSSRMGLGRVDKLHSLTRTCTKPTQGG